MSGATAALQLEAVRLRSHDKLRCLGRREHAVSCKHLRAANKREPSLLGDTEAHLLGRGACTKKPLLL